MVLPNKFMIVRIALLGASAAFIAPLGNAKDIYIAQNASGTSNGSSCANSYPYTFFNTSSNWGSGSTQISPGTTVHLCGVLSGKIVFQGSGTAGNPITVLFEAGAKMSAPSWGTGLTGAAIAAQGTMSYLVIDGGVNGLIECTNNGTSPTYAKSDDTGATYMANCSNCTVKNLTVSNMYVRTNLSDLAGRGSEGIDISGGQGNRITNNIVHDAELGIKHSLTGVQNGIEIDHNTVYNTNHSISSGAVSDVTATNFLIHDNEIYNWANWDEPNTNVNHHNGVFVYFSGTPATSTLSNLLIYNNYMHGSVGNYMTAMIFMDVTTGSVVSPTIFNNILSSDNSANNPTNGLIALGPDVNSPGIYNNTFNFSSNNGSMCLAMTSTNDNIRNNIFSNCGRIYYINGGGIAVSDYNDFYGDTTFDGSAVALVAWRLASALDMHSIYQNPLLTLGTFVPATGAPEIGVGVNLSSLGIPALLLDRKGAPRPSSGAWDIGPFQSGSTVTSGLAAPGPVIASVQ